MKQPIDGHLTLKEVAKHFKQWRSVKSKGERIPEHLWREAVGLLGNYKVSQVIRTLRLNGNDLNKQRRMIEADQHHCDADDGPAFVEINPIFPDQTSGTDIPVTWVELERPDGLRMRIQPTQSADMLALIDRFMRV